MISMVILIPKQNPPTNPSVMEAEDSLHCASEKALNNFNSVSLNSFSSFSSLSLSKLTKRRSKRRSLVCTLFKSEYESLSS